MKILVLGAGGVGGYFGAKLMRAGADVTFVLRDKRRRLIQEHGLSIEAPNDSFTVFPRCVTSEELAPDYDLIMLAPKSYDFADALSSIAGASSKGAILPFLNGLNHIALLDQRFGRRRVLGGVAHIAATLTATGAVRRLTALHSLTAGHRHADHESIAREFIAQCADADFDSHYSDDIEQVLWDKWVFLATLAGMTTLFQGTVGEIVATPYGAALARKFHDECCAIADRCGYPVNQSSRDKALAMLTEPGSAFTSSMLRDMKAGQRTEHEHILGEMVRRGIEHHVACDLVAMAYTRMAVSSPNLSQGGT
ncbi:MAG: 2-dehydropantoate 2-reductase [Rhodocyclales bacterium GWA2_65_20]|nr:MAG: 2-dehydropantoate 2-reductase [Rhodocyclales bacterium GWA2_65_20]